MICETCADRGRKSTASRMVGNTPMCARCFSGKPVRRRELLLDYEDNRKKSAQTKSLQSDVAFASDKNPFHGRRGIRAEVISFLHSVIPTTHIAHGMKGRPIRRFGRPSTHMVDPAFWRRARIMEERLILAVCTMRRPWHSEEIEEIKAEDKADTVSAIPMPSFLGEKDMVLEAIRRGCQNTFEICVFIKRPFKHVSAWLSVLRAHGVIEKFGEMQLEKAGRKTYLYRLLP